MSSRKGYGLNVLFIYIYIITKTKKINQYNKNIENGYT